MRSRRFRPRPDALESRALLAPVFNPQADIYVQGTNTAQATIHADDAGQVTYSLSQAPVSATIDPASGLFQWTTPAGVQATQIAVVASAADGQATERFYVAVFSDPPHVDAGINRSVIVGQTFTGQGTFASAVAGEFTATVDYSDGTGPQPLALVGHSFTLSHVFAAPGGYNVEVRVVDSNHDVGYGIFRTTVLPIVSAPTPAPSPIVTPTPTPSPAPLPQPNPTPTPAPAPTPISQPVVFVPVLTHKQAVAWLKLQARLRRRHHHVLSVHPTRSA